MNNAAITIYHNPDSILPSPQRAPFAKEDGEPVIEAKGRRVAS